MTDHTAPDAPGGSTLEPTFKPLYVTRVAVTGGSSAHARATGRARSADGALALELRMPEELGGDNLGPNPEQLFAAGYAACFQGALSMLARQHLLDPAPIIVEATVTFGRDPADGGYQLRADLAVTWPGVDRDTATPLLAQATALCPYAKMARQGIPATINLAC
ncbi:Ohr family peroxiredoxin [Nonomuraea sp. PA05]|uniref:Ohr family peroxiredoxin n=1 Tax=Nonomuraea sp. PA05 TaxID=2604466 RepID=UPI0011D6F041|nr:Ohr family peroxiredoxin [Nonomuraea sp. PA05]TYB64875.1 Ohr family peroxiredoxin [Nonomuraea sp. PA05]